MDERITRARLDRRTFLKGAGAAAGWTILRAATPAAAGLLHGPSGTEPYELVSLARVRADDSRVGVLAEHFDLTEHGRDGWFDVVLYRGDRGRLLAQGFRYEIVVEDLVAQEIADREAERAAPRLPHEPRTEYRLYQDYVDDMAALRVEAPGLVRHLTLPNLTHQGRIVRGLEIAGNVTSAATDGRPTSVICGLHHAREWPSSEMTIMFAEHLVERYLAGDARIVDLLDHVRVLIVPIVNPDGFIRSREALPINAATENAGSLLQEFTYHRKNMRSNTGLPEEDGRGVDPNRNYPYHWGGGGSSSSRTSQTYRGPEPDSEPEIDNLISLMKSSMVLTLITNHTYGNLVLRPWGDTFEHAPDEVLLKQLGDAMAAINRYTSQKGRQLYATTGTTEDTLYGVFGGFGYTYEHGTSFHPTYTSTIPAMWNRNREAFLLLVEAARNPAYHARLVGTAPPGTTLTLSKSVVFELGAGGTRELGGEWSMVVGESGEFAWPVNPSPKPVSVAAGGPLEPYRLVASHPGGGGSTQDIVVLRGQTYEVTV